MDEHFEQGRQASDDVRALSVKDRCVIQIEGAEEEMTADLEWDAALRLGEWLIAQAIARGVRP